MNIVKRQDNVWRAFSAKVSAAILLSVLGIFAGLFFRSAQLINQEMHTRAKAHFMSILLARQWNADHGGVYVEKKEGMQSNPYLENPDIESTDGKIYTKKNPALMTREISEYSAKLGLFSFHITSLKPLNPNNKPDEWEAKALTLFESGKGEYHTKQKKNDTTVFRYMAPLKGQTSCLECHSNQGYQVGDIRGGISVEFDIGKVERALIIQLVLLVVLGLAATATLVGIIYLFTRKLMKRLYAANKKIAVLAITDELTNLYNRRYFHDQLDEEFNRAKRYKHHLSCIMIDVDHFKRINDTHGHPNGDLILKRLSALIADTCRDTDTLARYGGEEFIVLLPETDKNGAVLAAGKTRRLVENELITISNKTKLSVTISLGVSCLSPSELRSAESSYQIISLADQALYKAKENGRNRVEVWQDDS